MFKNLVLAGGGIKLLCVLGAIKFLEENNYLSHITNFYGNSAGAILSLQLVLGYTSTEIIDFYNKFNLEKLLILNTDKLFNEYCLYDNSKLEKIIKLFITFKYGIKDSNITLLELYNKTKKFLSISTVSIKQKNIIYLSHLNYPDLYVWKAILMSSSIPLIFKPIEYNSDYFVDGALLENFPFPGVPINELNETLGIHVLLNIKNEVFKCDDLSEYMMNILKILLNKGHHYNVNYKVITINIDNDIIKHVLDLNLTISDKEKLINFGFVEIKNQIKLFQNITKNVS
jgi:NTE family protein